MCDKSNNWYIIIIIVYINYLIMYKLLTPTQKNFENKPLIANEVNNLITTYKISIFKLFDNFFSRKSISTAMHVWIIF